MPGVSVMQVYYISR